MPDIIQQVLEDGRRFQEIAPVIDRMYGDTFDARLATREFYEFIKNDRYDPYPFEINWNKLFGSPVEAMVFDDIRCYGLPMYPQYPVLNYFVDFGDPVKRIAIEVDGKAYHNIEQDRERDLALGSIGWTVYHVTGSQAHDTEFSENVIVSIKTLEYDKASCEQSADVLSSLRIT